MRRILSASKFQRMELMTASRKGKTHDNEDRIVAMQNLVSSIQDDDDDDENERKGGFDISDVKYLGVFDGHGGVECADYMATNLHEHIIRAARIGRCNSFQDLKYILADAFKAADEEFCSTYSTNNSGSCCAVALIYGSEILVAHVGDCRAVLRCNNTTVRLTRDHRASDEDEMKRVLGMGGKIVNGRVGGIMSPTRSFGDLDVREEWGEGILISEPDVTYATLEKEGDLRPQSSVSSSPSSPNSSSSKASSCFLLLASDGVFDEMSCDEVCKHVELNLKRADFRKAADKLAKIATTKTLDDCSVAMAVWCCPEPDTPTRVMSKRYEMVEMVDDGGSPRSPTTD